MTPYERLMAEALPTGKFGGDRPAPAEWTPIQQAQHVADLLAELDRFEWQDEYAEAKRERDRERYALRRAHLHIVPTEPVDETAA